MDIDIHHFCDLLKQILFCQDNLQPYKLSQTQLQQLFTVLDYARRGTLSVSDFYKTFSDLTQQDLFTVFKSLDVSRSGSLTLNDLAKVVGDAKTYQQTNDEDPVTAFKFCIKIILMNYEEIEKKKEQLKIDEQMLQRVYQKLQQKLHKNKIESSDFINLLSEDGNFISQSSSDYLRNIIFHFGPMGSREFIENFRPFNWSSIPKLNDVFINHKDASLEKSKQLSFETIGKSQIQNFYKNVKLNHQTYSSNLRKVTSHDNLLAKTYSPDSQDFHLHCSTNNWVEDKTKTSNQPKYNTKEWKQELNQSVNNTMDYIQKRREQLRRGSLERQKIVGNIMNRNQNSSIVYGRGYSKMERPPSGYLSKNTYSQNFSKENLPLRPSYPNFSNEMNKRNLPETNQKSYLGIQPCFDRPYPEEPRILQNGQEYNNPMYQRFERPSSPNFSQQQSFAVPWKPQKQFSFNRYSNNYNESRQWNKFNNLSTSSKYNNYGRPYDQDKSSVLRKAEEEALRKIQEIQRKAKMKVMEKRSAMGGHSYIMR